MTTVSDRAGTGLSQEVLLDHASRATGLLIIVLGAGSCPHQPPENKAGPRRALQLKGLRLMVETFRVPDSSLFFGPL